MKLRVTREAIGESRYRGLSSELSDALIPLVVSEKSALAFGKALANRFSIDLTGGDTEWGPIEAWLPEGRLRWDRALAALDYRHVRLVIHENPAFLATFACDRACEGEDAIFASFPEPIGEGAFRATLPKQVIQTRNHSTVWTLTAPMAHGADEKSGNVNLFRRHRVVNPLSGEQAYVPFMAGNAVRGVWRDMLMGRFCELVGVSPKALPPARVHALFSGGGVEKGADGAGVNLAVRERARAMCPPWDLIAGCTEQQIMAGRIRVHDAILVCAENDWLVFSHLRPGVEMTEHALASFSDSLPEAAELTQLRLGTRHAHKEYAGSEGAQMLFNTELVLGGAQFVHSFQLYGVDGVSPITASCMADLAREFRDFGTVGASNSRGFGLIAFDPYMPGEGTPTLPDPAIYLEHVAKNKQAMVDWLMMTGEHGAAAKAEKPAKAGRGSKKLPPSLEDPSVVA